MGIKQCWRNYSMPKMLRFLIGQNASKGSTFLCIRFRRFQDLFWQKYLYAFFFIVKIFTNVKKFDQVNLFKDTKSKIRKERYTDPAPLPSRSHLATFFLPQNDAQIQKTYAKTIFLFIFFRMSQLLFQVFFKLKKVSKILVHSSIKEEYTETFGQIVRFFLVLE